MYTALLILALLTVFITTIQFIQNRKWVLFYTAIGYENYFRVVAKLKRAGVKYKSKTPADFRVDGRYKDNTQYDIYVKKDEEHLAHKSLQGTR